MMHCEQENKPTEHSMRAQNGPNRYL